MRITDYITFDKLLSYLGKQYRNSTELSNFVNDLSENIFLMPDSYKNVTERAFLICMEDLPISALTDPSIVIPILEDEYSNGLLNLNKESLLEKYYIRVRVGRDEYDDLYSYKGIGNLSNEVDEIISCFNELKNFIKDTFSINFAEEFLSINDNMPKMLSTNRIVIYSALLNYSKSELDNAPYYKKYIKGFIVNIPENWDNIRVEFREFLEELSKRTINY